MTLVVTHAPVYSVTQLPMTAKNGAGIFRVVVKAGFGIGPSGDLTPRPEPPETQLEEEYWGEDGVSALRKETDAALEKPFTDLLVLGHACSPAGKPATEVLVGLSYAGRVLRKLRVSGDRRWFDRGAGWSLTDPEPFERMPVSYDRAYGGMDEKGQEPRNPAGVGYRSLLTEREQGLLAPNIERVDQLMTSPSDRPDPGGLGVIGRHWVPRVQWAGTYDGAWTEERYPLLPDDFDNRFNMTSHPDQWIKDPKAGDQVVVIGMNADQPISFQLPDPTLYIGFFFGKRPPERRALHLSSILIDTDERTLELTWTSTVDVHGDPFALLETVIDTSPPQPTVENTCC